MDGCCAAAMGRAAAPWLRLYLKLLGILADRGTGGLVAQVESVPDAVLGGKAEAHIAAIAVRVPCPVRYCQCMSTGLASRRQQGVQRSIADAQRPQSSCTSCRNQRQERGS